MTARPATAALRRALEMAGEGPLPADRDWPGLLGLVATEALASDVPWRGETDVFVRGADYARHDRVLALAARAWEEREVCDREVLRRGSTVFYRFIPEWARLSAELSDAIRALAGKASGSS